MANQGFLAVSGPDANVVWRRFTKQLLLSASGLFALFVAAIYLLDPYSTGRSPFSGEPRVRAQIQRTANASVGRNPRFTGAIIGNSTIGLISPERLTRLAGIPFAQLSMPAVGIRAQLALINWFVSNHPTSARALVISVDRDLWCTTSSRFVETRPFPFWLYATHPLEYLAGLVRMETLEEVVRRIGFLFSPASPASPADGYWDYEAMYVRQGYLTMQRFREALMEPIPDEVGSRGDVFPAADALETALDRLSGDIEIVLVVPPVFEARQPRPGTQRERFEQSCRRRYHELASRRPKTAIVDWWSDRPSLRSQDLFFDQIHYRHPLAREIENEIAAALARL